MIMHFKENGLRVFSQYQLSNPLTRKRRLLVHLVHNVKEVGCIEVLHGVIYKNKHKYFKNLW